MARRRINTRLLIKLILAVGVPLGVLIWAGASGKLSPTGDPQKMMAEARRKMANEKWGEAFAIMRRVPKEEAGAEAYYLLAKAAWHQTPPESRTMLTALNNATAVEGGHPEAALALAKFYWGATPVFGDEIEGRLDRPPDPNRTLDAVEDLVRARPSFAPQYEWAAQIHLARANRAATAEREEERVEELRKALDWARRGIEQAPDRIGLYFHAYRALTELDQPEEALAALNEAIEANPEDPDGYVLKARHLSANDQREEAEQLLRTALETAGEHANLYLMLADLARADTRLGEATELLQKAIAIEPQAEAAYIQLAQLHRRDGNRDEALHVLEQGAEAVPDAPAVAAMRADLLIELDRLDDARPIVDELSNRPELSPLASYLKGRLALAEDEPRRARGYLETARDTWGELPPNLQARLRMYRANVHLLLGLAYRRLDERGAATREFERLIDEFGANVVALRQLARVYAEDRRYERAAEVAARILEVAPEALDMQVVLAQSLLAMDMADRAGKVAREAVNAHPDDPRALLLMARVSEVQDNNAQAEQYLRRALEAAKKTNQAVETIYRELIRFFHRTDQDQKLADAVKQARTDMPEQVWVVPGQKVEDLEATLRTRIEENPEDVSLQLVLANLLMRTGRDEEAAQIFNDVLDDADQGADTWRRVWRSLFQLRLQQRDYEAANQLVERMRDVDPESAQLELAEPVILLAEGKVEEAVADLREKTRVMPSSGVYFLLGQILAQEGKLAEAERVLTRAMEMRGGFVPGYLMRARVRLRMGRLQEALQDAQAALDQQPELFQALDLKARAHHAAGRLGEAIRVRRAIAERVPGNAENMLRLASLYMNRRQLKEAETVLENAFEAQPESAAVARALAMFRGQTGRVEQGRQVIETFVEEHPDSAAARLYLGDFLAQYVDLEAAAPAYRKAFQLGDADPTPLIRLAEEYVQKGDPAKAEDILREALAQVENKTQVRKRLADVLLMQATEKKLAEAADVVDRILENRPEDVEAMVIRARVIGAREGTEAARAAFKDVLEKAPDSGEARLWLARLNQGRRPDRALMLLTEIRPRDPAYERAMRLAAEIQLRLGNPDEAIDLLLELIQEQPGTVEGRWDLAQIYVSRGEYRLAERVLRDLVQRRTTAEYLVRLGDVLYLQGKHRESAEFYRQARGIEPDNSQALMGLARALVQLDRGEEAIQLATDAMNENPNTAWPRLAFAAVQDLRGQSIEAAETISVGLNRNPKWTEGYLTKARILFRAGARTRNIELQERAMKTLREGLRQVPNSIEMRTMLGDFALAGGNAQLAADVLKPVAERFKQVFDRPGTNMASLKPLIQPVGKYALTLYQQEKVDEAIKWSKMVWNADSTAFVNANNLAWMLAVDKGKVEDGEAILRRALDLAPRNPQILDTMGWIQYLKEDYQQAREFLRDSIRIQDNAEARLHLARTLEKMGRGTAAIEHYERALELGGLSPTETEQAEQALEALNDAE